MYHKNEYICLLYISAFIKATEVFLYKKIEVILLFVLNTKQTLSKARLPRYLQNGLVFQYQEV